MKRMLLAVFSAFCFGASAQITVTSATFPSAGDTLRYAIDNDVDGISTAITPPGGNQTWDFTGLQAEQVSQVSFSGANAGLNFMSFNGAELVVIDQFGETYFNKTSTVFENMGYAGADPVNFDIDVIARYSPPMLERHAPMMFFDIRNPATNLTLPFSTEQIPDSLFQGAPFIPDSIRIRINTNRLDVVDAWGNCQIPGGQYQVLRVKRTDYINTSIDILVPFLGWVDLSNLLPAGGGFGDFIGADTVNTYHFYSGTEKAEIAVVSVSKDWSTATSIEFKNNFLVPAEEADAPGKAGVAAFPNPAVEWVRFDCTNLPESEYTLKIFNIVGKVVWKESYQLAGNKSIRVNLEDFKKGTYLYSLADRGGNVIGTKRLVVLKP